MATEVEKLIVRIEADTERLRREMLRATQSVEKSTKSINRHLARTDKAFDQLAIVVKRFAGPAALGLLGRQAAVFIREQARIATALDNTSTKLGVTTTTLQQFRVAAEQVAGVTGNTADMALQRFTRRLGEAANGGGELKGTLDRLGISVKDNVTGQTRSAEAVMGDLADAIQGTSSQSERLAIAFKAFDSEGAALVGLFQRGGDALRAFMQRASDVGAVLDQETIKELKQANDDMRLMQQVIDVHLTRALQDIMPLLVRFASGLAKIAGWAHDAYVWVKALSDNSVRAQMAELSEEIKKLEGSIKSRERAAKQRGSGSLLGGAIEKDKADLAELRKELLRLRQELEAKPDFTRNINVGGGGGGGDQAGKDYAIARANLEQHIQIRLDEINEDALLRRLKAEKEAREKAADALQKVAEREAKAKIDAAEKAQKEIDRIVARSTDRIVDFGADAFDKMFQRSKSTWQDIANDILATMRRTFAQLAAEALIRPIVQPIVQSVAGGFLGGGGGGGGGSSGGLLGNIGGSLISKALPNPFAGVGSGLSSALFGSTLTSGEAATLGIGQAAVGATSSGLLGAGGSFMGLGAVGGPIALAALVGGGLLLGSGALGGSPKTPRAGARVKINKSTGRASVGDTGATGGGNISLNVQEAQRAADALNAIVDSTGARLVTRSQGNKANPGSVRTNVAFTTRSENGQLTRTADDIVREALQAGYVQGISQSKIDDILANGLDGFEQGISQSKIDDILANGLDGFEQGLAEATNSLKQMNAALDAGKNQMRSFFDTLIKPLAQFGLSAAFGQNAAGSPGDQLAAARGQFASTLSSARGGDIAAIQALPGIGESVINLGREVFASGPEFVNLQRATASSIAGVQSGLEGQRNSAFAEFSIPVVLTVEAQTQTLVKELRSQTEALREIQASIDRLNVA